MTTFLPPIEARQGTLSKAESYIDEGDDRVEPFFL